MGGLRLGRNSRRRVLACLAPALCAAALLSLTGATPAGAIGFLGSWGEKGNGPGEFNLPISVATDAAGNVSGTIAWP